MDRGLPSWTSEGFLSSVSQTLVRTTTHVNKLCYTIMQPMQCDYTSYWAVCFQEWPEICIFVPRVRRTFLMWLWSLRMVSGWRHTRWSWLPPAASVWQKIAKKNIRIHWSLWEEFRAISNTVGTFDFWRTLSLHLIQILCATFYVFSSFWSSVSGGEPKACAG